MPNTETKPHYCFSQGRTTMKVFPRSCLLSKHSNKKKTKRTKQIIQNKEEEDSSPHVFFKQPTRWDEASEEMNASDCVPQPPHRQETSDEHSSISSDSSENVEELIANFVSNLRMEQERTRKRNSLVPKAA